MKPLREFFMEAVLESRRFSARFNFGESGSRARTVGQLLCGSGWSAADAGEAFLRVRLNDSPNWGRADLRDAIARMHPGACRENVLVTTGTSEALLLLFRQLRPSRVALAVPAFQLLYELPSSLNAQVVYLPVEWRPDGAPYVDAGRWIEIVEATRPDCLVWNSPHNPSGLRLPPTLLDALRDRMGRWSGVIVGDEHYRMLASPTAPLGPTAWRPDGRTFVTGSFIKCLGCPGLRIGWCVGDPATLAAMQNEKNFTTHTVNPVAEWIAHDVLQDLSSPIFTEARAEWSANRARLASFLERSQTVYGVAPSGGLVTTIGFRGMEPGESCARRLAALEAAGVFVLPLETMEFGQVGGRSDGHALPRGQGFRFGLGEAPAQLAEGLDVLEATLSGLL